MDTTRKRAKRLAEFAYPDVNPANYPSKDEYIKEKLRLIDLRAGFVRGYLARRPEVRYVNKW
jgi:hypothetical protein